MIAHSPSEMIAADSVAIEAGRRPMGTSIRFSPPMAAVDFWGVSAMPMPRRRRHGRFFQIFERRRDITRAVRARRPRMPQQLSRAFRRR